MTDFSMLIYGAEDLERTNAIFVCISDLDAITFNTALAIRGTDREHLETFFDLVKQYPDKLYLLALDNTDKGRKAQKVIEREIDKLGANCISCDINRLYNGAKTATEASASNPQGFNSNVDFYLETARAQLELIAESKRQAAEVAYNNTGAGMLDAFLKDVQTPLYENVPTGIKVLDYALEGGFMRKELITLGAAPGMGKTAIAQYILENMALRGYKVMYFNLEMDRAQLIARSIARTIYKNREFYKMKTGAAAADLTTKDVLRGYKWTPEQKKVIEYAAAVYKSNVAGNFIYNPAGVTNELSTILDAMRRACADSQAKGEKAPLFCVDYLQLINYDLKVENARRLDTAETLREIMHALKQIAIQYETTVLVIIAHNRTANKEGRVTMESARDSSNIEYGADVMLGLSYTAVEDREALGVVVDKDGKESKKPVTLDYIELKKDEAEKAGAEYPLIARRLCIKVIKDRFGQSARKARFIYDGKHANFEEEAPTWKPTAPTGRKQPAEDLDASADDFDPADEIIF